MVPSSDLYCLEIDLFCPNDSSTVVWQCAWVCKPTMYQLLCAVQEGTTKAEFAWIRPSPKMLAEYDLEELGDYFVNEYFGRGSEVPPINFVAKVYDDKLLMRYIARHHGPSAS